MTFKAWIHTFVEEKGIDREEQFESTIGGVWNLMPYGVVIDTLTDHCTPEEQAKMKSLLVRADFKNADIRQVFRDIAAMLVASAEVPAAFTQ